MYILDSYSCMPCQAASNEYLQCIAAGKVLVSAKSINIFLISL